MPGKPTSPFAGFALNVSRGAKIILIASVVASVAYMMCSLPTRAAILPWVAPTGTTVWRWGRVWTLLTGPLLEPRFLGLVMQAIVLVGFVSPLERHWGTARVLRFAGYMSLAGTIGGTLVGLALGHETMILGLDPFVYGTLVAFGVLFARQPVRFFGAVPMTAKQLAIGILTVLSLLVVIEGRWAYGGALASAVITALWLTSRRYNPRVLWKRLQLRRAHLQLVKDPKAAARPKSSKQKDERFLN